jgi:hypothetical protein
VDPVIVEQLGRAHPLARHLDDFLIALANADASPHTRRAYRSDLIAFAAHHGEEIGALRAAPVRGKSNGNCRQAQPVRTTYKMASTMSRRGCFSGLPPVFGAGSSGSTSAHWASVRSEG